MSKRLIAIISTGVNILLAAAKLIFGFVAGSAALLAEGIHSGMDIFSSAVTYFGIKSSERPVDEKHPYGYYRAEGIAGFVVMVLLFASALWILYEGVNNLLSPKTLSLSVWAIAVMAVSAVINEVMARVKFHFGNKFSSVSLVADGEHSRADVVSSVGVFIGLLLARVYPAADALVAILVGIYILWETYGLYQEVIDSLLDVSDKETKEGISKFLKEKNINYSEIKTRKIGGTIFAEFKIKLDPRLKVEEATRLTSDLERELTAKFEKLKQISISVESHDFGTTTTIPRIGFGGKFKFRRGRGIKTILERKAKIKRTIIPVDARGEPAEKFGAANYLIIEKDKQGKTIKKEKIKNPYFTPEAGRGVKFAKSVNADRVLTRHLGKNARDNLRGSGIEFEVLSDEELRKIIEA